MPVKIVCISDTHTYHKSVDVPPGDILIHAGDSTNRGYQHEIEAFGEWLRSLPHMYKIVISGNHDFGFRDFPGKSVEWLYGEPNYDHRHGLYYLQDSGMTLDIDGETINVWGSPWQPWFHNWAFNAYPPELKEKWDLIPSNTDILITHGPPYKLQDKTSGGDYVGCRELRTAIQRIKPKLHVCGHIHESHGVARFGDTLIANASICTLRYNPTQEPLQFEYEDGKVRQASKVSGQEKAQESVHYMPDVVHPFFETTGTDTEASTSDEGQEEVHEKEEE